MSSSDNPEGDNARESLDSSVSTHIPPRPPRHRDPRKLSVEHWLALNGGDV